MNTVTETLSYLLWFHDKDMNWLAEQLHISKSVAFALLEGQLVITKELADKLSNCFDVTAVTWLAIDKLDKQHHYGYASTSC